MSKYDEGIEVAPRSRADIRRSARSLRSLMGVSEDKRFPVMGFVELALPMVFDDFVLEIAPRGEMGGKHGETHPKKHLIRLREDVYEGACNGNGRDLYTVVHEIGHLFMHVGGYSFSRRDMSKLPLYRNSEWQADVFAAELLMPYSAIRGMNPDEVKRKYGVSISAARVQYRVVNGRKE